MSQSSRVANHYNQRPEVGTARRQESPIIGMKKFNNYTKSLLITKFTPKQSRVLDLACGKGGDLLKWKNQRINSLLGLDIAKISVQQAEKRFRDSRFDFNATFDTIDCFSKDFKLYFQKNWYRFDVVSCQFAIHYCFETEEKLRIVLETIADILEPGGHFIGTVPNSTFVMKNLDNCQGLEFGNSFYKIKFEQRDTRPEFGHKYQFYLEDAIDDCPEYVAHRQSFIRIANEYGLECVLYKGFHDFFRDESQTKEALDLLHRMRVFDHGGRLNELDWETAANKDLYRLVFYNIKPRDNKPDYLLSQIINTGDLEFDELHSSRYSKKLSDLKEGLDFDDEDETVLERSGLMDSNSTQMPCDEFTLNSLKNQLKPNSTVKISTGNTTLNEYDSKKIHMVCPTLTPFEDYGFESS